MKKGLCVLLSALMILSVAGCTDSGSGTASQAASSGSNASSKEEGYTATALIAQTASLTADGSATFDLTDQADTQTALRNPDKGWYLHYYDDGTWNYGAQKSADTILGYMSYLDHIYMRLPWCTLEPEEGEYRWTILDNVIEDFAEHGVAVSFRITCKEGGSYCPNATPKWVQEAGAKGNVLSDGAWEPDYGDEIFLQKLENFHKAFAARYANNATIRYIDVGSYGDYGEGHTANSSNKSWPWEAIKKHFDIYAKYYPNTKIAVSDDFIGSGKVSGLGAKGAAMREYVLEHGWTWRDDSICVNWFMKNYSDTDSVRSPFLFEEIWESQPVIMELEHYKETITTGYHDDNWQNGTIFKAACRRTHATYAGFHGFVDQFMTGSNVAYAAEMANLLGYWYFLDKMDVARSGNQLTCKLNWRNEGFAKAYNKYDLDLILTDAKGEDHVYSLQDFDNTKILPKAAEGDDAVAPTLSSSHTVDLGDLASGEYFLSLRMHKDDTPVLLALNQESKGTDGRYTIAKVTL